MGYHHPTEGTPIPLVSGVGGTGSTYSLVQVLTQSHIDNGITLEAVTESVAESVLTVSEAGGLRQTPTVDYTITGTLLTFTEIFKAQLFPGYEITLLWS